MKAIEFVDVCYSYDGTTDTLDHLDLSIDQGERVAVLGHNGSGKSTLARCVNALIVPDSGSVRVMGLDTADPANRRAVRRSAGMVFQNPDDQIVGSAVCDDVAFGPENLGLPQPEIALRVDRALASVGMAAYAQANPADLSGGQKQRVGIAGMLAMDPAILVFDESTAMLDPRGRADVAAIIRELSSRGITIVQVTHFMEEALEADRVIVLEAGRVALEGAPEEVFAQRDKIFSLGLELPFAARLGEALQSVGVEVPLVARSTDLEEALCRLLSRT